MRFDELNLHPETLKAILRAGFTEPTPIQRRCIPEIKAGRDVVGQSLTGSGKTAAFGLPMLEKIQHGRGVQTLVLVPTRELADQVGEALREFSQGRHIEIVIVYGGVGMQPQIDGLRRADIVVATPGRMLDHLRRKTANLSRVSTLILDEADKMYEMGFIEDVDEIINNTHRERQTLLFSATMPSEIHTLVKKHLRQPVWIREQLHVDKSLLKQVYYDVKQDEKFSLLVHLLRNKTPGLAIVFCSTRREVDVLTKNLHMQRINALAVHGGLSQNKRSHAVDSLRNEDIPVLVATDVAARGLDIQNISHIYNYDSPKSSNEYTHRIGRTARAGKYGEAVTLLSYRDHDNFRNVMDDSIIRIQKEPVPQFERIPFLRTQPRGRGGFSGRGGPRRQPGYASRQRPGMAGQRPRQRFPQGQRRFRRPQTR